MFTEQVSLMPLGSVYCGALTPHLLIFHTFSEKYEVYENPGAVLDV